MLTVDKQVNVFIPIFVCCRGDRSRENFFLEFSTVHLHDFMNLLALENTQNPVNKFMTFSIKNSVAWSKKEEEKESRL